MTGVTRALAAFERTLLSFDLPYDRFRRGQAHAISPMAKRGAALFFGKAHCAACHSGINFTDGKFHKIGFYNSYPAGDRGLIEISGAAKDDGAFRTPSLRNVALTGPICMTARSRAWPLRSATISIGENYARRATRLWRISGSAARS